MTDSGTGEPWQARDARRLVTYPLDRLDDWDIRFATARADEEREGSTWLHDKRIVIYVRPDWSVEKAANALAHELGHVHDALYLSARMRDAFLRARGLNWRERYVKVKWPAFTKQEPRKQQRVGSEDFAEVFALRWGPASEFQSTVRPPPSSSEMRKFDRFLHPPA